ncbi:MAG: hypothetical protein H6718_19805 [Polyangiaceae bacterium]|nr:hypothetical protein [Polyangiaceae bacterium]MCB9605544.1 hypothetical protein [Polyangiaceae bacterium]
MSIQSSHDSERVVVISQGLAEYGQREIAFAVKLRPSEAVEAVTAELHQLLDAVESLAAQGKLVEAGGFSEFGRPGFLNSSIQGLVYASAQGLAPEFPNDALLGVFLHSAEVQVAKSTCALRLLSRLGQASSHFPFPPTTDRDRPGVAVEGDEESLLAMVAKLSLNGACLSMSQGSVRLRCNASARQQLARAFVDLPPDAAFALVTEPDPEADGRLVWYPGQTAPAAITPPNGSGQRLTGCMLLVARGATEDTVRLQEDGFALVVRDATWAQLSNALVSGSTWHLPSAGNSLDLRVEPLDELDGRVIH